jgi:peptide/nickel transport system permease protein
MTFGAAVGTLAAFYGGFLDDLLMRSVDVLLSIPSIYLLILLSTFLPIPIGIDSSHPWFVIQHNPISIAAVIAVTSWGGVARLVRGEVLALKARDFVLATRSIGASDVRLMLRHLLPNAMPVLIVSASLGVAQIILLEAALDFIGLGVQPPVASWGNMLGRAQEYFYHSWLLVVLPGACIALVVLAANVVGNSLRDALDPRLRS